MAELGAISAIVGLIGIGTKLSLTLFDFASSIGSAGQELQILGTEVSLICSVTTQLGDLLGHATFHASPTAIDSTFKIIERCQQIFEEIEGVIVKLRGGEGALGENVSFVVPTVDFVARVKWTFKKSKMLVLRQTLESCKITLNVMLTTMVFAQRVSVRRSSSQLTREEDNRTLQTTQSLIISQHYSLTALEQAEAEKEREDTKPARTLGLKDTRQIKKIDKKLDRLSGLLGNLALSTSHVDLPNTPASERTQRASIWLRAIVEDIEGEEPKVEDEYQDPHPGIKQRLASSVTISSADKPMELLRKWTDQAERLEWLDAPLRQKGHGVWGERRFSLSAPHIFSGVYADAGQHSASQLIAQQQQQQNQHQCFQQHTSNHAPTPNRGIKRVQTDTISPKTSRQGSTMWSMPVPIALTNASPIEPGEQTTAQILGRLLRDSGVQDDPVGFELGVTYGGQTKVFQKDDKPFAVVKQCTDLDLHPRLFAQRIGS